MTQTTGLDLYISSTSKTRLALGGIAGGAPRRPYPSLAGTSNLRRSPRNIPFLGGAPRSYSSYRIGFLAFWAYGPFRSLRASMKTLVLGSNSLWSETNWWANSLLQHGSKKAMGAFVPTVLIVKSSINGSGLKGEPTKIDGWSPIFPCNMTTLGDSPPFSDSPKYIQISYIDGYIMLYIYTYPIT